jgi:N-dimethylarginine dimethylaminohydrolase
MSPPDYFTVAYAINPWMTEGEVRNDLARAQWDTLYRAITDLAGARVSLMPPVEGLPDLVFTANAAFVHENKAIIAHYKYPERQGEEPHCREWFGANGYEVLGVPDDLFFEGAGDALLWKDRVFAGYKTRTDILSHAVITHHTGLPILSLELVDPRFYHIDTCICPLYDEHFIYYPEAFDEYGLRVIDSNVPPEKRIPVAPHEAYSFACNAVSIGESVIFNQQSDSRLPDVLRERGFNVIQVDLSEFLKAGGSAKCLTLRLA